MAVLASAVWRVRTGGNNANGGGYDAGIAGAATDYSQQDAAQASASLGTSTASTTFTDAGALFTSAMVGNALWLASGTGTTVGAYFITGFTNATTITLDRASGTYTAGVWKIGGAWADPATNTTSSGPLVAGNQVYIRGAGSDNPVGSPDYTVNALTATAGSTAAGRIKFIGENGRPHLRTTNDGRIFYNGSYHYFYNLFLSASGSAAFAGFGLISDTESVIENCVFDQNNIDLISVAGGNGTVMIDCEFLCTSRGTAGTQYAVTMGGFGNAAIGCYFHGVKGKGVNENGYGSTLLFCIIAGCASDGVNLANQDGGGIYSCTIDSNGGAGVITTSATALATASIVSTDISNNTSYGYNVNVGSTAVNDRARGLLYNNNFYNNSVSYNNLTAPATDTTLNPTFTNAAAGDYSIGTNLKGIGYPGMFLFVAGTPSTGYLDIGAVQRQESTSGGGIASRVAGGLIA